jgi:hypothetical protein
MELRGYIGDEIMVIIPDFDPKPQLVTLLGVEAGGIWIESQTLNNKLLKSIGQQTWPGSPTFFFPYHAIRLAIGKSTAPALGEEAFGVKDPAPRD